MSQGSQQDQMDSLLLHAIALTSNRMCLGLPAFVCWPALVTSSSIRPACTHLTTALVTTSQLPASFIYQRALQVGHRTTLLRVHCNLMIRVITIHDSSQ